MTIEDAALLHPFAAITVMAVEALSCTRRVTELPSRVIPNRWFQLQNGQHTDAMVGHHPVGISSIGTPAAACKTPCTSHLAADGRSCVGGAGFGVDSLVMCRTAGVS